MYLILNAAALHAHALALSVDVRVLLASARPPSARALALVVASLHITIPGSADLRDDAVHQSLAVQVAE
jgi:hypothetical protein